MKNEPPVFSSGPSTGGSLPNFLQSLLGAVMPPDWVVDELQNRIVLFLNHVLMQEKAAQDRLRRQKGKPVKMQWGEFHLTLTPTAAGLLVAIPSLIAYRYLRGRVDGIVIDMEKSAIALTDALEAAESRGPRDAPAQAAE